MNELISEALRAPIANLLIVAGLIFLGVAVFSKLSKNYKTDQYGRIAAGVFGSVLVLLGIFIHLRAGATGDGTPTPAPTGTPTAEVATCPTPVHERFREVYDAEREQLGCPAAAAIDQIKARQSYEKGTMFWRQDTKQIYVLYDSRQWQAFADTWDEDQPVFSCTEAKAQAPPKPQRGFGKVWCNESGLRDKVGRATAEETVSNGDVQDFETGGAILLTEEGETFVLYPTGRWRQR